MHESGWCVWSLWERGEGLMIGVVYVNPESESRKDREAI